MTRKGGAHKKGLNRGMRQLGLARLIQRTIDKATRRGGEVVFVNPKYTSQECSSCGFTSRENRKSQAIFKCIGCGLKLNADKNASLNVLARGLA